MKLINQEDEKCQQNGGSNSDQEVDKQSCIIFLVLKLNWKKNIKDDFKQLSCIIIKRLAVPERGQVPPAPGVTTYRACISIRDWPTRDAICQLLHFSKSDNIDKYIDGSRAVPIYSSLDYPQMVRRKSIDGCKCCLLQCNCRSNLLSHRTSIP